jgi:purine-binding chemotaxis protein CheW
MFRDGVAQLLVFRLGAERFAVDLALVDEVIDAPASQRLPDAPANVVGLASIRGELVSVYDARSILHVGDERQSAALLFVRDGRRVALAIDDVFDAITVDESELIAAPAVDDSDRVLVGLVRRNSSLIAVVDAGALLDAAMAVTDGERR